MKRPRWLNLLSVLGAVLILAFFVGKSLSINFEENQQYQNALSQQKEENAILNQEIIKSRYELLSSYDPLVKHLSELKENQKKLNIIPKFIEGEGQREIQQILKKKSEILKQTESLLERFKSQNAVLKNSLRYLPSLSAELLQKASSKTWNQNLTVTFEELQQNILLYNLTSDEELAAPIKANIERLLQLKDQNAVGGDDSLTELAIGHTRIILSNKPEVDKLTQQLLLLPTTQRTEELNKVYNSYYQKAIKTANTYRLYAYGWSLILLGWIAYLVINNLVKANRRTINFLEKRKQAESALQKLNEELETRVEERTSQLTELLEVQRLSEEKQRSAKEKLQQRVLELQMEVDPVSKGDLTVRAKVTPDEIGSVADSYNSTLENLRKIVAQVQTAAQQVADTTSSNETAIQALSEGALQQTRVISTALDRIQAMAYSARTVAANAEQAEATVKQAAQMVEEGDAVMNRTVDGILAIRETTAEKAKKVKRLGESSQKISKVVNLIRNFALQTNLLAVNASIEAARAGKKGLGFAVVAEEVQSLAQRSAQATAEIEKLVADIHVETNEVVAAIEADTEQVVAETKLVDETRQSLNQIMTASTQINQLVAAIAQAAVEQSQASEAVTQIMEEVSAIAGKTSTSGTNVSASFKELLAVALQLQESVGQFKVK